jgi:hypothetical protein
MDIVAGEDLLTHEVIEQGDDATPMDLTHMQDAQVEAVGSGARG